MPDRGGGPAPGGREAHPGDPEECRHQGRVSLPGPTAEIGCRMAVNSRLRPVIPSAEGEN